MAPKVYVGTNRLKTEILNKIEWKMWEYKGSEVGVIPAPLARLATFL